MEEIITTVSPAMVDEVVILPYNVAVSFDTATLFFFDLAIGCTICKIDFGYIL